MTASDSSPSEISSTPHSESLALPLFLHGHELDDALRAVTLFASGRDPFGRQTINRLTQTQQDDMLRALCIVVSSLAGPSKRKPPKSASRALAGAEIESTSGGERPLEDYLDNVERRAILNALSEAKYNQTQAARLLGITFRALRYRIARLEIDSEANSTDGDER